MSKTLVDLFNNQLFVIFIFGGGIYSIIYGLIGIKRKKITVYGRFSSWKSTGNTAVLLGLLQIIIGAIFIQLTISKVFIYINSALVY